MQLLSKFNKEIDFLLWIIYIFSKYAWVTPLEKKISIEITNAFQKTLDASNRKWKKILLDKGNEFYNRSMKSWYNTELYSTYNLLEPLLEFIKDQNL